MSNNCRAVSNCVRILRIFRGARHLTPCSKQPVYFLHSRPAADKSDADSMAKSVAESYNFPKEEENILELWKKLDAFKTSLKQSEGKPRY